VPTGITAVLKIGIQPKKMPEPDNAEFPENCQILLDVRHFWAIDI